MKSLRSKITFITICAITITIFIISTLSVIFIKRSEHKKSDQLLLLLCESGKKNLDYYFNSVQKSVDKVSNYVTSNINGLDDTNLENHVDNVRVYFDEIASKTNGVLTYYYRIDPEVSQNVEGFWYTDLDGKGFVEHTVTDISQYDTTDTTHLVWFTIPKNEKRAIWITPYITDNLDKRVISYNEPIFYRGTFVGVIGIEIDYEMMAEQVNSIRLFGNGYAFLNDDNGNIFYHPFIDIATTSTPDVPKGLVSEGTFFKYTYEGVKKEAAWLPLTNGMRINVAVPISEMEGDWQKLVVNIVIVAAELLVISMLVIILYTNRISKPLKELTFAAEQVDKGNFDFELKYKKDDEVGRLTNTFNNLANHMKENLNSLSKQVFVDSMTQVKNKAAFTKYIDELQQKLDSDKNIEFAIGIFDCNNLKKVNDKYGHSKGDVYLRTASQTIKSVFHHTPVFRIGGDEFAVILEKIDLDDQKILVRQFEKAITRINNSTNNIWETINIAYGIANYDSKVDRNVDEVVRRADKLMYDDKTIRKMKQNEGETL